MIDPGYSGKMSGNNLERFLEKWANVEQTDENRQRLVPKEVLVSWSPSKPEMYRYEHRLKTFSTWPTQIVQNPKDMTLCGFFYTGYSDKVMCFSCGVTIDDWDSEEIPSDRHSDVAPACEFLLMTCDTRKSLGINATCAVSPNYDEVDF